MLTYLFAALAGCANAFASVLQRKADKEEPTEENLSLKLIVDLLHNPIWFLGILGVIAGFLLQAAALANGALSVVEPILIIELPITLLLARAFFHKRMHTREWTAALAITVGLAGLLYFLSPSGGRNSAGVSPLAWSVGIAINVAVIGGLVGWSRRDGVSDGRRAAFLGIATGSGFGLTAALIKAMTEAFSTGGITQVFLTWQTYAMVVAGALAMFLLQSALNAGPLVAAQPGFTTADPVVSILWGVLAFHESVRGGLYLLFSVISAAIVGWGVFRLSRSPLVSGDDDDGDTDDGSDADGRDADGGDTDDRDTDDGDTDDGDQADGAEQAESPERRRQAGTPSGRSTPAATGQGHE